MTTRRVASVSLALAAFVALASWITGPDSVSHAEESSELEGLQVTFAPAGVTFFDARSGDVWIHPFQITGATGVAHFRVSERGAKLTAVPDKK